MVTPSGSDQQFTCQVWQKSPVINEQTRQGTARCALSYDPALRPGGFANVTLASGTVVAPRLPESAIMHDEQGSYVYIVGDDNTVALYWAQDAPVWSTGAVARLLDATGAEIDRNEVP